MGSSWLMNHSKCKDWKNMLDFPDYYGWEISRYYLACYCHNCRVWFPLKTIGKICPCCHAHVRFKPLTGAITRDKREIYEQRMKEFKTQYPEWTLVRKEILKPIIDLKILKGEI